MVKIVAEKIIGEKDFDSYVPKLRELLEKSRAETGNILFEIKFFNMGHGFIKVRFFEVWKDEQAIGKHAASTHVVKASEKLAEFNLKDVLKEKGEAGDNLEDIEIRFVYGWATVDFASVSYMEDIREAIGI